MDRTYTTLTVLLVSTILFGGWYVVPYRYIQQRLTDREKELMIYTKNYCRINNLNRSCSLEKESLASLHNQYQQCIAQTKECSDNNESIMQLIIELLEKNKLTLDQYKRISKEKKEWHSRYTAALSFHGTVADALMFFQQLTLVPNSIIPDDIELRTHKQSTQVTTNISWIVCV